MFETVKVTASNEQTLEDGMTAALNDRAETHDLVMMDVPTVRVAYLVFKAKP